MCKISHKSSNCSVPKVAQYGIMAERAFENQLATFCYRLILSSFREAPEIFLPVEGRLSKIEAFIRNQIHIPEEHTR